MESVTTQLTAKGRPVKTELADRECPAFINGKKLGPPNERGKPSAYAIEVLTGQSARKLNLARRHLDHAQQRELSSPLVPSYDSG